MAGAIGLPLFRIEFDNAFSLHLLRFGFNFFRQRHLIRPVSDCDRSSSKMSSAFARPL